VKSEKAATAKSSGPRPPPRGRAKRIVEGLNNWQTLLAAVVTTVGALAIALWASGIGGNSNNPSPTASALPPSVSTLAPAANLHAVVPASYVGVWKGTLSQAQILDYPVILTIRAGKGGSVVGSTSYPTLGCDASLTLLDTSSTSMTLDEETTSNGGPCAAQATLTISLTQNRRLSFTGTGKTEAESTTAVLTRSP
jgi:eukaryotic-like serine/threonine-protein kinase